MCLTHVNCRRRQQKTLRCVATFSNPRLLEKKSKDRSVKTDVKIAKNGKWERVVAHVNFSVCQESAYLGHTSTFSHKIAPTFLMLVNYYRYHC